MSPSKKTIKRLKTVKPIKDKQEQDESEEIVKTTDNKQDQEPDQDKQQKTEIQKLNETLENRENASVAAIKKLTAILIANMKTQQDATTAITTANAAAGAAAANKKIEEENTKNLNFKNYFQPTENRMETNNDDIQKIVVEEIKTTDNNLLKITNDYTEQLRQIHNTNMKDPNIPQKDAIQARQNSIQEINTINMIVKSINTMKQQIKKLSEDNNNLKESNQNIKMEVNNLKETINNQIHHPASRNPNHPQTTDDNDQQDDNNGFQTQKTRNNRNKTKIGVSQLSPGPGENDDSGLTPTVAYAKVVARYIQTPPKTKLSDEMIEKIQNQESEIPYHSLENEDTPREKIPKEKMERIKDQIKKSSQVVGVKPITNYHIHQETTKIIASSQYDKITEKDKIKTAAVKNAIFRFLKEEQKMDEKTRNSLKIQKNSLPKMKCPPYTTSNVKTRMR